MDCGQTLLELEWQDCPTDLCEYIMGFVGFRPHVLYTVPDRADAFICNNDWICEFGEETGQFVNVRGASPPSSIRFPGQRGSGPFQWMVSGKLFWKHVCDELF